MVKKNKINDQEMLKTFNCGVGFCIIINPKNLSKVVKCFFRYFYPYIIGHINKGKNKVQLNDKISW